MHGRPAPGNLDFLTGEVGALMRVHDWSGSSLGSPAAWPLALRALAGVMLGSSQPKVVAWGPERLLLYNDGFARILGAKHPAALGRPLAEVWEREWGDIRSMMDRAYAGEATQTSDLMIVAERNGQPEEAHVAFSCTPVRDEAGAIAGVFCPCLDVTAQVMADRRQSFRLALEERLRDLADPREIMAAAAELLGRHLRADQASYAAIDEAGEFATIEQDWNNRSMPSNAGLHRLAAFGPDLIASLKRGETVAIADVALDPRTRAPAALEVFRKVSIAAFLNVPLVKDGRLVAIQTVHSRHPRVWSAQDEVLAAEVAERTWSAIARARAEAALKASEARQAFFLALGDRLRMLADPRAVMAAASEALGRHLGADRVGYDEFEADGDHLIVTSEWQDGTMPTVIGHHRLSDYTPELMDRYRAGETIAIHDFEYASPVAGAVAQAAHSRIGVSAQIAAPLAKEGRLAALLFVHSRRPRRWSDEEVALVREAVERTWDAVERARAEATLRAERDRSRRILDSMGEGCILVDREFRVLDINREGLRIEGRSRDEIVGRLVWEAWPRSERGRTGRLLKHAMAEGEPASLERPYPGPDGARSWLELRAYPSGDGLAVFFRDITERRQAEERLRASEAQFRTVAEALPGFAWTADAHGLIDYVSPRWSEYSGVGIEGTGGENWLSFLHPDDVERAQAIWAQATASGGFYESEFRLRGRDGAYRWWLARALPVDHAHRIEGEPFRGPAPGFPGEESSSEMASGTAAAAGAADRPGGEARAAEHKPSPTRWIGTCTDIDERKRAEEALSESQRQLNAVLDNASVAIFLMNEAQHCVYMNAAAEALTGFSLEEVQGRILHEVIHHTRPDGSRFPREECPIGHALPEGSKMQGEEVFVHKDGSFYPVAFTASPIRDEQARSVGTIIEVRNIQDEKTAQEHQRLLINELNHRVKNTLATVQSIASQTLRNAATLDEAKVAFESRLLALSRAHDVLTRENWEGAELRTIVAQAVEPYRGREEGRLQVRGPGIRLPPRMALALAMALQELATNAVKYGALSNDRGTVRIAWAIDRGAPSRLRLTWEETGGPPVRPPSRRGFGSRLIERSLAQDLDGTVVISFDPAGVRCSVDAPISGFPASA